MTDDDNKSPKYWKNVKDRKGLRDLKDLKDRKGLKDLKDDFTDYTGNLVGSGNDGDVFRPPLPCKKLHLAKFKHYATKHFVGKCFNDRLKAINTIRKEELLDLVDPDTQFTIRARGICNIQMDFGDVDHVVGETHLPRPKYKAQIIYPYVGRPLLRSPESAAKYTKTTARSLQLLFMIIDFVRNVANMNDAGVFHGDIQYGNVLQNKTTRSLYLIDYGFLSSDITDLVNAACITYDTNIPMNINSNRSKVYMSPEMNIISSLAEALMQNPGVNRTSTQWNEMLHKANRMRVPFVIRHLGLYDKENSQPNKKVRFRPLSYFGECASWYTTPEKDLLFSQINSPFYKKLLEGIVAFASPSRDTDQLVNLFTTHVLVAAGQDAWGLGTLLLQWLIRLLRPMSKKDPVRDIFVDIFCLVSNTLVVYDLSHRATTFVFYDTLIGMMKKKYPDILAVFKSYVLIKKNKSHAMSNIKNENKFVNVAEIYLNKKAVFRNKEKYASAKKKKYSKKKKSRDILKN